MAFFETHIIGKEQVPGTTSTPLATVILSKSITLFGEKGAIIIEGNLGTITLEGNSGVIILD
jgi:hypothetical protein